MTQASQGMRDVNSGNLLPSVGILVVLVGAVVVVVVAASVWHILQDFLQNSFMISGFREHCPSFAQFGQSEMLSEHSAVSLDAGVVAFVVAVEGILVVVLVAPAVLVVLGAPPWHTLQDILQYSFM